MKTLLFLICFLSTSTLFAQQNQTIDKSPGFINNFSSLIEPLYVIDEMEYKMDSVNNKNLIYHLDPTTIERVEVLKGQSATDLYGDKGKNGVVIITTKEFAKKSKKK